MDSVLKDIGIYKNNLISVILNSSDICELMLGKDYTEEQVFGGESEDDCGLMYNQVFPFLYVEDTQTKSLCYLCVEVNVPKIPTRTIKDLRVIVWAYSNKTTMKYSKTGYQGTKTDILADMVERQLSQSNDFGIGKLHLDSVNHIYLRNDFYGREMIFTASDFKTKEC